MAKRVDAYGRDQRTTDTIERDGNKESKTEKPINADAVALIADGVKVRLVKTFASPRGYAFREFTPAEKKPLPDGKRYAKKPEWVDLFENPGYAASKLREVRAGAGEIKVRGDFTRQDNAGHFPLYCEGNLKSPPGPPGPGAPPQEFHWAAKVLDVALSLYADNTTWTEAARLDGKPPHLFTIDKIAGLEVSTSPGLKVDLEMWTSCDPAHKPAINLVEGPAGCYRNTGSGAWPKFYRESGESGTL